MSFRLKNQESVGPAIRRVAAEQVAKAIAEAQTDQLSSARKVHQVRKRCKKLRGVLRLVRPQLEDRYAEENAFVREIAGCLSGARDSTILVSTYDQLAQRFAPKLDQSAVEAIRQQLGQRGGPMLDDEQSAATLSMARQRLEELAQRIEHWRLEGETGKRGGCSFSMLSPGMSLTYAAARKALLGAQADPLPETLHQWRKQVKYHAYQCRLLHGLWPRMISARAAEAERLGQWLGDHHDLSVLRVALSNGRTDGPNETGIAALQKLIEQESRKLEQRAIQLGKRLFAEKAKRFVRRHRAYWDAAHGA